MQNAAFDTPMNTFWLALFTILISALITLAVFKKNKSEKSVILLIGSSNTGKTSVLNKLKAKKFETIGSMEPTTYKSGKIEIVDLPGHTKLKFNRDPLLEKATSIIYFTKPDTDFLEDLEDILCTCNCIVYFVGKTEFEDERLTKIDEPYILLCQLISGSNKPAN